MSNYHTYISELVEKERYDHVNVSQMDDHVFAGLLHQKGVKSIYNVPIKTLNGKIIGILGVDYVKGTATKGIMGFGVDEKDRSRFDEESYQFMKRQARIIAGYLL